MIKSILPTTVFFFTLMLPSLAQKGIIRGTVYDDVNGEPLIGVTVVIKDTSTGTITDIDGNFEIKVDPGIFNLQLSYVSYATMTVQNVKVEAGKVNVIDNIRLKEDVTELAEIVVTADAIKTTEEALLTVKKKSPNLLDAISYSSFRKIGDTDAAAAVKRVPGVSVQDGRYVYVRGLGDRYTKSTLNGVDIPGLDPDRNTVQMDLFSTNLIDNIIVLKSFTSDLPGDFTGGIVNINTKDFPEEKILDVSMNVGYNPLMHFINDYLTYQGGKTDYLGIDDGTRAIPTGKSLDIPQYADVVGNVNSPEGTRFRNILEGFNPVMTAMRARSFMDYGFGFNLGNQKSTGNNTIGYNLSLTYKNSTEYYEGAEYGRYGKGSSSIYKLDRREFQTGDFGVNDVSLSGIAGIALKKDRSKYKLNIMHSQNGQSKAGIFNYEGADLGSNFQALQHNLEYSERALTNILLSGNHFSANNSWEVNWKLSPTHSLIEDPDIRFTRIRLDGQNYTIGSEVGYPERIWRFLEEYNMASKIDVTKDYKLWVNSAHIKFGAAYTYKERNYEIRNFQIIPQGVTITKDPNILFSPDNLWPTNDIGSRGTRYEALFIPANTNKYNADAGNSALYISNEFRPAEKLKAILGVRVENHVQHYSGMNQQGLAVEDETVLDDIDLFSSVNLIYSLAETQNLRFSFSRTIARPSFREASYAEILDPLTGRTYIGGFFQDVNSSGEVIWDGNLTATRINNFDLRWEIFQRQGQTIAASVFYKMFDKPIEIVQYVQAPNNFQPRNVGNGEVKGVELEIRQNLEFITESLRTISINGNLTYTQSAIEMSSTEYNSRLKNAREGENINNTRDMAGQAPYIVNAGLSYNGLDNGLEAGVYYFVQGPTLTYVGVADRPDVYSMPFHSLNFSAAKAIGTEERLRLGLKAGNILGDVREEVFSSHNTEDQIFTRIRPGASYSVSLGYRF